MQTGSTMRAVVINACGGARRLAPLAAALVLAALLVFPAAGVPHAQTPPAEVVLVNAGDGPVERKKDGRFVARPVFDRRLDGLFYGIRHPETGDWLTAVYRVIGGETALVDGWQYEWEYPALPEQPDLEPDRAYVLVMLAAETLPGDPQTVRALVPVYEPGSLWERVIRAMDPGRWARAFARWVVEGVHGTLCAVLERATGAMAANCDGS
ncbi:MAG: hypothetical protein OXS35_00870 [Dehalococcoidia bacterium]|nr:hypothetical protein [Dehalococcoidia bacterium]